MTVIGSGTPAVHPGAAERVRRSPTPPVTVTGAVPVAIRGASAVTVSVPACVRIMPLVKTCVPASAAVNVYESRRGRHLRVVAAEEDRAAVAGHGVPRGVDGRHRERERGTGHVRAQRCHDEARRAGEGGHVVGRVDRDHDCGLRAGGGRDEVGAPSPLTSATSRAPGIAGSEETGSSG